MTLFQPNGKIKLEESTHKYILEGHEEIEFTSVTTCIAEFFEKFDKNTVAYKLVTTIPKYKGRTAEDLINEWDAAANYGTAVHKEIEDYIKLKKTPEIDRSINGVDWLNKYLQKSDYELFSEVIVYSEELKIAGYNSIDISLDEFSTNRVNSYSLDIGAPRTPIYAFNDRTPSEVISNSPLSVSLNFNIEPDDYKIKNMRFVPEETVFRNVRVRVNKNNSTEEIQDYFFKNLLLVSEQYSADNNGNVGIQMSLQGTILR